MMEGDQIMRSEDWITKVILSQTTEQRTPAGDRLPAFPDATLQVNTTSLSGEAAIRQAGAFFEDVAAAIAADGRPLSVGDKVLDFGCGWGRIGRMFLRDVSLADVHGLDVDPAFVEVTRHLFGTDNFKVCNPSPPTPLQAGAHSLVVSYSVFSHLSEDATRAWLREFHRLLQPGGYLAFTTRHASFLDYLDWARTAEDVGPYTKALGQLFRDTDVAREQLRAGQFLHATSPGVSGGGVRDESFYGETWVTERWLDEEFAGQFERIATCFDPDRYDQVAYVLRRQG